MIDIVPSALHGRIVLPASKSHTLRAILFASLADGVSQIDNILDSPDTEAMIRACQMLGATILRNNASLEIYGGIDLDKAAGHIEAENSGIVLRFMAAVASLGRGIFHISGDESCKTRRPCRPLLDGLSQLGAKCSSNGDYAPFTVQGPITAGKVVVDGSDSQPVSALMIAASMLKGTTQIQVNNIGEKPWLAMTLYWLRRLGVGYEENGKNCYSIHGQGHINPFSYRVPADFSSCAFPLVAAILTESELVIEDVDLDDVQGDKVILSILEQMGAKFLIENSAIHIRGPQKLYGCDIDVNDCIDALPILSVVGCYAEGQIRLYNGAIARNKESDRIASMKQELTKMGADCIEHPDGLTIRQSKLHGASLYAHNDHRVAMALTVAALAAKGKSTLDGGECVQKTYKNFFLEIQRLSGVTVC